MVDSHKVGVEGVLLAGPKGLAVEVPFDPVDEWGTQEAALPPARGGYAVEVLLNRVRFRSAIVSRVHRFFVLVDESMARRAGSAVGKPIRLMVWADGGFLAKVARPVRVESARTVRGSGKTKRRDSGGTSTES